MGDFASHALPEPIAFESFDDLDEFALPEGWAVKSYVNEADAIILDEDPDDWTSMYLCRLDIRITGPLEEQPLLD